MLDAGADPLRLQPAHHRACAQAGQQRILGIVFKVPAAERTAVHIDRRSQPDAAVVLFHLERECPADPLQQILVPRAREHRRARPRGCRHTGLLLNTQACTSVCCHRVRHGPFLQIAPAICVCHAGIRLSSGQGDQLVNRQLLHKRVERMLSVRDIIKQNPLRMLVSLRRPHCLPCRNSLSSGRRIVIHQIRDRLQPQNTLRVFACRKRFKASVRKQPPGKLLRLAPLF